MSDRSSTCVTRSADWHHDAVDVATWLLISDLDETLVERREALLRWAREFVAGRGLPANAADEILVEDHHGRRSRPQFVAAVNDRLALDPPLTLSYLGDYVRCFQLDPDTADALRRIRAAGWRIGIASNGEQPQVDKVDHVGLRPLVDAVAVSGLVGVRKPDPALLQMVATLAGAPLTGNQAQRTWMVGDDPDADMGAAHAAGIRSVWIRRGRRWPADLDPPTAQADSFVDAVDIVLAACDAPAPPS